MVSWNIWAIEAEFNVIGIITKYFLGERGAGLVSIVPYWHTMAQRIDKRDNQGKLDKYENHW
jgi:hypothetical protein